LKKNLYPDCKLQFQLGPNGQSPGKRIPTSVYIFEAALNAKIVGIYQTWNQPRTQIRKANFGVISGKGGKRQQILYAKVKVQAFP
jgi:hypothetical protein